MKRQCTNGNVIDADRIIQSSKAVINLLPFSMWPPSGRWAIPLTSMSESFRTSSVKDDIHDDTNDTRPDLASLGLAVIDEIRFHDGKIVKDVLGGSGSFCTAGARLFSNKSTSRSIAWRIHAGDDFPDVIEQRLRAWEIDVSIYRSQGEASTRGLLVYADKGLNCEY